MIQNKENTLEWIQEWYYAHCDGDWEHNERFIIENVDNPGWSFSFNLEDTCCENMKFQEIDVEITEINWYQCYLRDGKFEGAGGPFNLIDILNVFRNWVESCQKEKENA